MSSSQTNKCLNEKRRRDQENVYIEELAKLISEKLADMNSLSLKPDKCAILQETVKQIRIIKQGSENDDLQTAEVSSSKPNIIASDVLGPLLLEALDGFLIVINQKGIIEFVSENVSLYLKFKQNKLVSKSIFDFVHSDDHSNFENILRNNDLNWSENNSNFETSNKLNDSQSAISNNSNNFASTSASNNSSNFSIKNRSSKSKVFNSRFKVKLFNRKKLYKSFTNNEGNLNLDLIEEENNDEDDDEDDDLDDEDKYKNFNDNLEKKSILNNYKNDLNVCDNEKRENTYLNLQISAVMSELPKTQDQQFNNNKSTNSSNKLYKAKKNALVCVARRLPLNNCESSYSVEQFSTKMDINGKILDVDTTGLSNELKNLLDQMSGKLFENLINPKQVKDFKAYLKNVIDTETSVVSDNFDLLLNQESLTVKIKSKKNKDFLVSTHSIIKPIQFKQSNKNLSLNEQNDKLKSFNNQHVQLKTSPIFSQTHMSNSNTNKYSSNETNVKTSLVSSNSLLVSSYVTSNITSSTSNTSSAVDKPETSKTQSKLLKHDTTTFSQPTNQMISSYGNSLGSFNSSFVESNNSNVLETTNTSSIEMLNESISISDLFPSSSLLDYDNLTQSNENSSNTLDFNLSSCSIKPISLDEEEKLSSSKNYESSNNYQQVTQNDKLRNLLTQQQMSDMSLSDLNSSSDKKESFFLDQLPNLEPNVCENETLSENRSSSEKNSVDTNKNNSNQNTNSFQPSILNHEKDEELKLSNSRPSSSLSNSNILSFNNSTNSDLESMFEKCNTLKNSTSSNYSTLLPGISTENSLFLSNTSNNNSNNKNSGFNNTDNNINNKKLLSTSSNISLSNSSTNNESSKGNNMLRKLLNDDDVNKNFRKGKDVLIQQLLRENSTSNLSNNKLKSPVDHNSNSNSSFVSNSQLNLSSGSINSSTANSNDFNKFGPLKRKSNEDHFSIGVTNQTNNSFLNSSNNSCFSNSLSNSQPGTPMQVDNVIDNTYPSAKRLSLSESLSRPSSTPIPVTSISNRNQNSQMRYSASNNNMNQQNLPNSQAYPHNSINNNTNSIVQNNSTTLSNALTQQSQQSQQLAGQNPMLAHMLAQTPKTLPVSTISIPTSIVSQVPQERLPKNLEKKLIHTPTTTNSQYSSHLGQFDSTYSQNIVATSNMNCTVESVSSLKTVSSNLINQSSILLNQQSNNQQKLNFSQQAQHQYFINNSTQTQQQMKPVQLIPGQFIQSNDQQQQTPLSTHILNNNSQHHQPVQPTSHSVQVSGSQYLNNKAGILPNISSNNALSPNENKSVAAAVMPQHQSLSSNSNNSTFVMNNQIPIMSASSRNQSQLTTSTCSFYTDRITSSSNNISSANTGTVSSSVANSSSTNVTSSSTMMNNISSCLPSSSIDANDLNQLNNIGNSMSNTSLITSTVIGSPSSASNAEDTLLLKLLDEFTSSDSPTQDDTSPNLISSTTLHQQIRSTAASSSSMSDSPNDLNEKLAISAIQKQLMSFDTATIGNNNSNSTSSMQSSVCSVNDINLGLIQSNSNSISCNQIISNNNVGILNNTNNFGPPPAYQQINQSQGSSANSSSSHLGRIQNSNINVNNLNLQNQQNLNCNGQNTNSINTVNSNNSVINNSMNNSMINNRVGIAQPNIQINSNFVQHSGNSGIMNNMLNTGSSVINQLPGQNNQTQMIQISNSTNQRLPQKNNLDRKQKMQFSQQIQSKRFVTQSNQIQIQPDSEMNKNNSLQSRPRVIPTYTQQQPFDQQPTNSPQTQQAINSTAQNISPIQRSKNSNSTVINQSNVTSAPYSSSYPSPSSQHPPSPLLQASHRNISSPHAFSPSSPVSNTMHHQQTQKSQSQLPILQTSQNLSQQTNTIINSNNNNCWSNLPPKISMRSSTSNLIINSKNNVNSNLNNTTNSMTVNRMQQQNPILNAQLSQDSMSYVQVHPQSSQVTSNQSLSPPTNSSSMSNGISMRFNRNSPVLNTSSSIVNSGSSLQQQFPSSPSFHNVASPSTPPMQQVSHRNLSSNSGSQRLQQNTLQPRNMNSRISDNSITVNSGQNYYSNENIVSRNINMNNQQQVIYGNCVSNNVNSNNASSEYVKQGLRAKLGARSHQQQQNINHTQNIPARAQMPLIQQQNQPGVQSQQHLSHIQPSVHHLNIQQQSSLSTQSSQQPATNHQTSASQQPVLSHTYSSSQMSSQLSQNSPQHLNQQLNSSLTAEDFDAMGIGLELSDSIGINNDSPFFNFNDLSESNTMDGLDLGGINSLINVNSDNSIQISSNSGMIRNQSISNAQSTNSIMNQKGSLLQQLLSEPLPDSLQD